MDDGSSFVQAKFQCKSSFTSFKFEVQNQCSSSSLGVLSICGDSCGMQFIQVKSSLKYKCGSSSSLGVYFHCLATQVYSSQV